MNTHKLLLCTVTTMALVLALAPLAFANPVHVFAGDFNLPIPAMDDPCYEFAKGRMADAVIDVPSHLIIADLDVTVTLTHEALFDLQIILQSPEGTNVLLNPAGNLAFIGRDEDDRLIALGHSGNLFFDDQAEFSIEQAEIPFDRPFRPAPPDSLSRFQGQDAFGPWRLKIHDRFDAHAGTLQGLELTFTIPEPATAILLLLGTTLLPLSKPRRNILIPAQT